MKICKECKHARPDGFPLFWFQRARWRFATCAVRDDFVGRVTGESDGFCTIEREFGACGPEGKNWEPR